MDRTEPDQRPDYTYGVGSLAMALAIRDSQVPVPIATEIGAHESDAIAPSLREPGIVEQILAGVCIALLVAFVIVVAQGL